MLLSWHELATDRSDRWLDGRPDDMKGDGLGEHSSSPWHGRANGRTSSPIRQLSSLWAGQGWQPQECAHTQDRRRQRSAERRPPRRRSSARPPGRRQRLIRLPFRTRANRCRIPAPAARPPKSRYWRCPGIPSIGPQQASGGIESSVSAGYMGI